jgi:hypothetical protein
MFTWHVQGPEYDLQHTFPSQLLELCFSDALGWSGAGGAHLQS